MRGAYHQYIKQKGLGRYTDAVERIKGAAADEAALRLEAQELRLARIFNGAEPEYRNGSPKDREKGR